MRAFGVGRHDTCSFHSERAQVHEAGHGVALPCLQQTSRHFPALHAHFVVRQRGWRFSQLLQIVTQLRSGCVRLPYRILFQVWQKKSVRRQEKSAGNRNDQSIAENTVNQSAARQALSLSDVVRRRTTNETSPAMRRQEVRKEEAPGRPGLGVASPEIGGDWLQGRTWAAPYGRVVWKEIVVNA